MVSAREGIFDIAYQGDNPGSSSLVTPCGLPLVTMLIWLRLASVKDEKQDNSSEMTVLLGCTCCFAQRVFH